jgi:coatomer protein complex subunit gamma
MVSKTGGFSMVPSFMRSSQANPIVQSTIIQYHALGMMAAIRHNDRMATAKLVQMFTGAGGGYTESIRDPFAHCMIIRLAAKSMEESNTFNAPLYDKLCSWLRNRSDMVSYEAAKAVCNIPNISQEQIYPAIRTLQQFLSSSKATLRFAAIRTLNRVAIDHAAALGTWKLNLDELVSDSNRSVATFAITALLKIGTESTVDSLIKQVSTLMSEMSDEFRVIVVEAIKSLGLKFPNKHGVLLSFLSGVLRDEGGFEFKQAVVNAIIELVQNIPECKEAALSYLCEFIEDCEFSKLSVKVLHLLGAEGPKASAPTLYIRFIYNRVVLETAVVRAAAVSALSRFGVMVADENVKKSVQVLLTRCLEDPDDEVRDRAAWALKVIKNQDAGEEYVKQQMVFHLATLEQSLAQYCSNPEAKEKPFDATPVPVIPKGDEDSYQSNLRHAPPILDPVQKPSRSTKEITSETASPSFAPISMQMLNSLQSNQQKLLEVYPDASNFGPLLKTSPIVAPIELTESEVEYVVKAYKHIFAGHVIFEYIVTNTVNEVVLENLVMDMVPESDSVYDLATGETNSGLIEMITTVSSEPLYFDQPKSTYVIFSKKGFVGATFQNTLNFITKEYDPSTEEVEEEGFDDEYGVEALKLQLSDYVVPAFLASSNEGGFKKVWEELGDEHQQVETFSLGAVETLEETVEMLLDILGLQAVDGKDAVPGKTTHHLTMTGKFNNQTPIAARVRMAVSNDGVTMELGVRTSDSEITQLVMSAVV